MILSQASDSSEAMEMQLRAFCLLVISGGFQVHGQNACNRHTEFRCNDGTCLSKISRCDGNSDCQNREDEQNCGYEICGRSSADERSGSKSPLTARIIGGVDSEDGEWPWQALLTRYTRRKQGQSPVTFHSNYVIGGGSLINNRWVLTAGHVFGQESSRYIRPKRYIVSFGIQKRPTGGESVPASVQMFRAAQVHLHPNFSIATVKNDIALIMVGSKLDPNTMKATVNDASSGVLFTYHVRPVCLPCATNCLTNHVDNEENSLISNRMTDQEECAIKERSLLLANSEVIVSGFGYSSKTDENGRQTRPVLPETLQHANLHIVDNYRCLRSLNEINRLSGTNIVYDNTLLCCDSTKGKKVADACQGDSGGPVVKKVVDSTTGESCWVQVGVVSFGYGCAINFPGYYTNVARYSQWINSTAV